jgi:hypothetical protein
VHSNGPPSSPLQSESIAHESLGIQFYTCYPLYMPHKKKLTTRSLSISVQLIERRIYLIRGQKVMDRLRSRGGVWSTDETSERAGCAQQEPLLNRISHDFFAGKDLSDTTLESANLRGADLRGTNLENVVLSGAVLRSSRFFRKDFFLSTITCASISLYVLKTRQTRNYDALRLFNSLRPKLKTDRTFGLTLTSCFRDDLVWEMFTSVTHIRFKR